MTTRTRYALLLALVLAAFVLCACDDGTMEFITGDQGANRAHGRQTGAETTLDLNLAAVTPPAEEAERTE